MQQVIKNREIAALLPQILRMLDKSPESRPTIDEVIIFLEYFLQNDLKISRENLYVASKEIPVVSRESLKTLTQGHKSNSKIILIFCLVLISLASLVFYNRNNLTGGNVSEVAVFSPVKFFTEIDSEIARNQVESLISRLKDNPLMSETFQKNAADVLIRIFKDKISLSETLEIYWSAYSRDKELIRKTGLKDFSDIEAEKIGKKVMLEFLRQRLFASGRSLSEKPPFSTHFIIHPPGAVSYPHSFAGVSKPITIARRSAVEVIIENLESRNLYFSVLNVLPEGDIIQIHPDPGHTNNSDILTAGSKKSVGFEPEKEVEYLAVIASSTPFELNMLSEDPFKYITRGRRLEFGSGSMIRTLAAFEIQKD